MTTCRTPAARAASEQYRGRVAGGLEVQEELGRAGEQGGGVVELVADDLGLPW
ncbi:hypothetical protein ACRAWF_23910 [Streptomyces sp. L7]